MRNATETSKSLSLSLSLSRKFWYEPQECVIDYYAKSASTPEGCNYKM